MATKYVITRNSKCLCNVTVNGDGKVLEYGFGNYLHWENYFARWYGWHIPQNVISFDSVSEAKVFLNTQKQKLKRCSIREYIDNTIIGKRIAA